MGSSLTRDQSCLACIGRQILYYWATKEAPFTYFCAWSIPGLSSESPASWLLCPFYTSSWFCWKKSAQHESWELQFICQQIWKTQQWTQDWKRSVFISIPKKGNAKECSNDCTIVPISHASKLMLKILQARLQQYMNHELPDVQAGIEKAEEPKIKLPTSAGSCKKQESSRKTSISALLTIPKPLTVWITINCGIFLKRGEHQIAWPASWETYMQVRKQQNWTWNNRLVPDRKRSMSRLYIVTLLI